MQNYLKELMKTAYNTCSYVVFTLIHNLTKIAYETAYIFLNKNNLTLF